jgi:hypothetical protein
MRIQDEDDPPNHDRSRKINITLEHPRLSLKDGRGGALLTFKFSGCYQRVDIKDQPKRDYPSNLELLLSTEVMSVSGTFNGHFEAGNHPKTSAHQVVLTDDAPSSTYGVVLVFPPGLTATVQNSPTGSTSSALLAKVKSDTLTNIQEYFESQTFQYHIAAISNSYDQATPGAHVLKPKAFSFSTIPESTNPTIPGALCIWIALEGSSNATTKKDRETTLLGFAPDGTPLTPIPMNNEASIIFDGETFNDLFLKVHYFSRSMDIMKLT